ncbi:PREDICTED: uncharacterized protein LOC105558308 [Vollenhovia emeryi]|uniref:uncharacterized protein LOC105558308 n=1 Tax=Vollenhovia emeryi TaxID=411798 RepID=UPI0005F502D5|nr:PREDICTED: uncharacterized protein LOC105558308 [Vollenhovia emeryi]
MSTLYLLLNCFNFFQINLFLIKIICQLNVLDEAVDDYAFMALTETDLKEINIKNGPRKRILSLINNHNKVVSAKMIFVFIFVLFKEHRNSNEIFDIRSWVERHDKESKRNPSLISILESGVVKPVERQELVRICCAGLIKINNDSLYPSNRLKTDLASQIVTQFPKLSSTLSGNGYEHFYDSKTNQGFIEFRLKTMRKRLSPSKKKRTASKELKKQQQKSLKEGTLQNEYLEDLFQLKVAELSLKMPNNTNKADIFRLTDETRCNRQRQVKNSDEELTLSNILQMYPRFKDYNGELIKKNLREESQAARTKGGSVAEKALGERCAPALRGQLTYSRATTGAPRTCAWRCVVSSQSDHGVKIQGEAIWWMRSVNQSEVTETAESSKCRFAS